MSFRSFRARSRGPRPRARPLAAVSLLTALILAGCGGSTSEKVQTVRGHGFTFEAPADWTVDTAKGSAAAPEGAGLLQVSVHPLVKPYRPAEYAKVAAELDRTVASLARQPELPGGKVVHRADAEVAGRKVRSYRIEFDPDRTEELAFVLQDTTEYLLLCRRLTKAPDADCSRFFSSFALTGG